MMDVVARRVGRRAWWRDGKTTTIIKKAVRIKRYKKKKKCKKKNNDNDGDGVFGGAHFGILPRAYAVVRATTPVPRKGEYWSGFFSPPYQCLRVFMIEFLQSSTEQRWTTAHGYTTKSRNRVGVATYKKKKIVFLNKFFPPVVMSFRYI